MRFRPLDDDCDQVDRFVQVTFFRPCRLEEPDILDREVGNQRGNALVHVSLRHTHGLHQRGYQSRMSRSTKGRETLSREILRTVYLRAGIVAGREKRVDRLDRFTLVRTGGLDLESGAKACAENEYADNASGVRDFSLQPAKNA